jgi:hypothetical protein
MGQTSVSFSGQLLAAPAAVSDSQIPAGTDNIPFNLNPPAKPFNVSTGNVVQVNSPASFVTIPGVGGAVGPVTMGSLLYMRTLSPMRVRKTYGSIVIGGATGEPFSGLHVIECDPASPLTLLEVMGAGQIEFWVCGLQ